MKHRYFLKIPPIYSYFAIRQIGFKLNFLKSAQGANISSPENQKSSLALFTTFGKQQSKKKQRYKISLNSAKIESWYNNSNVRIFITLTNECTMPYLVIVLLLRPSGCRVNRYIIWTRYTCFCRKRYNILQLATEL